MPKVIDDHVERNFRSYLAKRSTLTASIYLMRKLGICKSTAIKYVHDPESMKIRDLKALGFTDEEILGICKE